MRVTQQVRAYMSVEVGQFYDQKLPHAFLQFHPVMRNTGQTPAFEVAVRGRVIFETSPLPANYEFALPEPVEERSVSTFARDGYSNLMFYAERRFTDLEINEFKSPNGRKIYCYGVIEYTDVTNAARRTEFCYHFAWSVQGAPVGIFNRRHNKIT